MIVQRLDKADQERLRAVSALFLGFVEALDSSAVSVLFYGLGALSLQSKDSMNRGCYFRLQAYCTASDSDLRPQDTLTDLVGNVTEDVKDESDHAVETERTKGRFSSILSIILLQASF